MQSLWLITKKNLRLLVRSKSSAVMVFFAPLLIILVLGLAYNTSSQYSLNIGVYASSFTDDVESFISLLQEQQFRVITYDPSLEGTLEECIDDIKLSAVHTCISLPESFQVAGNEQKEVTFYLDPSRINLVWMIQETLKDKFNLKSQELSHNLAQELLGKLSDAKTAAEQGTAELGSMKEKTASASSSAESAKSALSGLDLSVQPAATNVSVLDSFESSLSAEISASSESVQSARDELDDANMTASERDAIGSLLDDAQTDLNDALALLSGTGDASLPKVKELVAALQEEAIATRQKVEAASSAISGSSSNLNSATSTLQSTITAMEALQEKLSALHGSLASQQVTDPETIASPFVTKIEKVRPDSTYLNYSFPSLLVLVIMFTSLLLGTILVMMEKNSPAFMRNYLLPVKKATFVMSIYLTNLALILIQIIVILGISLFFLKDALVSIPAIALVLFVSASVFTFLGMAIGYLAGSEETGALASIAVGSILLFLSGVVLPLEVISPALREITAFNPFVLAEKLIREIFIFNAGLNVIDLLLLAAYAVALFLIILVIESVLHQRLTTLFLRRHHKALREKDKINRNEV